MSTILSKKPLLRTVLLFIALVAVIALAVIFRPKPPLYALADLALADRPDRDQITTAIFSVSTGEEQAETFYSTATTLGEALDKATQQVSTSPKYTDYAYFRLDVAYSGDAANPSAVIASLPAISDHSYFASSDIRARKLTASRKLSRKEDILTLAHKSARYIASQIDEDGRFVYGRSILSAEPLPSYSINTHAATISALLRTYVHTGDEFLQSKIKLAIDYLLRFAVANEKDDTLAYIENAEATAIDLSATALTIVALSDFQDISGDTTYEYAIGRLVGGMESMYQGVSCRLYTQELELDLTSRDNTLALFYDAQATYALLRAAHTLDRPDLVASATRNLDYIEEHAEAFAASNPYWIAQAIKAYEASPAREGEKTYTTPEFSMRTVDEIYAAFTEPWVAMFSADPPAVLHSFWGEDYITSLPLNQSSLAELLDHLNP